MIYTSIIQQILHFSGHFWRKKAELAANILFWEPSYGKRSPCRPCKTYSDELVEDTLCRPNLLPSAMENRYEWRNICHLDEQARPGKVRYIYI